MRERHIGLVALRRQYQKLQTLWTDEQTESLVDDVREDVAEEYGPVDEDPPRLGPGGLELAPAWRESARYRGEWEG